jgi:hypothetical protein
VFKNLNNMILPSNAGTNFCESPRKLLGFGEATSNINNQHLYDEQLINSKLKHIENKLEL